MKDTASWPLYPQCGIHWSKYGMSLCADSLFDYIASIRGITLPDFGWDSLEVSQELKDTDYDVLVTAEAKSIPLAHALSAETNKAYVVLRKSYKPYMGDALKAETLSITTGQPQTLILDEKDRGLMHGKKVVIVDDVISTGFFFIRIWRQLTKL